MANIYGLLRVKNEARWIARVIRSIQPLCQKILVLDDHSTDETREICERLGCRVLRSQWPDICEWRDRNLLLVAARTEGATTGDYCLMIDGDEILDPESIPAVQAAIDGNVPCASFHIVYLWDREDQARVDRWYREFRRPSLFRIIPGDLSFKQSTSGGGFHCSSAPLALLGQQTAIDARLFHFGYLYKADRIRKYEFYNRIDPGNMLEDGYRHMVIGDIFPADSNFIHAGPLELQPISGVPQGGILDMYDEKGLIK